MLLLLLSTAWCPMSFRLCSDVQSNRTSSLCVVQALSHSLCAQSWCTWPLDVTLPLACCHQPPPHRIPRSGGQRNGWVGHRTRPRRRREPVFVAPHSDPLSNTLLLRSHPRPAVHLAAACIRRRAPKQWPDRGIPPTFKVICHAPLRPHPHHVSCIPTGMCRAAVSGASSTCVRLVAGTLPSAQRTLTHHTPRLRCAGLRFSLRCAHDGIGRRE